MRHNSSRRPTAVSRGFTLVELLVVIAIIALLISILLPSLARAREQAKKAKCLANQKDIAVSMNAYSAEDANEHLIPVHWRGLDWLDAPEIPGPGGGGGWLTFVGQNEWGGRGGKIDAIANQDDPEWVYQFTAAWNFGPGGRPLNQLIYKDIQSATGNWAWNADTRRAVSFDEDAARRDAQVDMSAYHCPSDVGWPSPQSGSSVHRLASAFGWDPDRSHYDVMGNSYRTQAIWANGTARDEEFQGGDHVYTGSVYMRPSSQVPTPSRVVLTTEGNAYYTETWQRFEFNSGNLFGGYVTENHWATGWHGEFQKFTVSFTDGHAGTIEQNMRSDVIVSMPSGSNPTAHDFLRGPWKQVGSRPEWIYTPTLNADMYSTIMARGDGWQLDCLPAPTVVTMFAGNNG